MSSSVSSSCSWCLLCAVSECCSPSRRLSGSLAAGVPGLPAGSARARRTDRSPPRRKARRQPLRRGRRPLRPRSSARWSVCTVEATTRRTRRKSGGQLWRSSLLVGRVACHRPDRTSSPSSAQSRAPVGRSPAIAGVRSAVPGPGPGTPCPGRRGATRPSRWCPPPLLGRAVCLPSAASSAPTQRSRQALRFASLRES